MLTRQTLKFNNLQLSYLEWKQGKKPFLALHGLADHGLVWSSLGDYLAPEYHVIAPDLRGHGESSKPEQGYRFAHYIEDLEALMNHLGWKDAHILGHSWGAKLAAIWAAQHPSKFRSLILVDPFFINKMPSWFELTFPVLYKVLPFLKIMKTFPSYEAAEKIAKGLKQYRGWTPLQQQIFKQAMEQKADGTWSSKFTQPARNEIFQDVMAISGLTKPLNIPTLFIKPQQGLNRTQWQINPYKTYLNNLQIEEVPGNHWAFLVEPEAFNKTIKTFLNQQEQANL